MQLATMVGPALIFDSNIYFLNKIEFNRTKHVSHGSYLRTEFFIVATKPIIPFSQKYFGIIFLNMSPRRIGNK